MYMALQSYLDVLTHLEKQKRSKHLLLGNGFSVAYDANIFSYNALHDFISNSKDELLISLFAAIKTKNFELIMEQLTNFVDVLKALKPESELIDLLNQAKERLKFGLLEAIKTLHPEHVFKIDEQKSQNCANFLSNFLNNNGKIFSTNYDILLYWVLLRNQVPNHKDGFGRDQITPGDTENGIEAEYSELRWGRKSHEQNVFHLHGALPLFDARTEVIKEEYSNGTYILDQIKSRIDSGHYPIFVTAGNGDEKLEHITHNKYLANAYENLTKINGSLITFGFSFGPYDDHIIHAINRAAKFGSSTNGPLRSIYIGVYSDADAKWIESIEHKFGLKVNTFDAKTAPVWHGM